MYMIEMDGRWVTGESKGWVTTTSSRSMAALYPTLSDSQAAVEAYVQLAPMAVFTIHHVDE